MAKSAINRHHRDRILRKRLKYPRWQYAIDLPELHNWIARNTKPCSCWACGHVRDSEGPTIQEQRQVAWLEQV